MTTTYHSYYHSSSGQPRNCEAEHATADEAVAAARALRGALLLRSGGEAVAYAHVSGYEPGDPAADETLYRWIEHAEGGFEAIPGEEE